MSHRRARRTRETTMTTVFFFFLTVLPFTLAWTFDDVLSCNEEPRNVFDMSKHQSNAVTIQQGYYVQFSFWFSGSGCGTAEIVEADDCDRIPSTSPVVATCKTPCASTCELDVLMPQDGCLVVQNTGLKSEHVWSSMLTCAPPHTTENDDSSSNSEDPAGGQAEEPPKGDLDSDWKRERILFGVIISLGVAFLLLIRSLFFFHNRMRHARWAAARHGSSSRGGFVVVDGRPVSSLAEDDGLSASSDDDESSSSNHTTTFPALAEPFFVNPHGDDDCGGTATDYAPRLLCGDDNDSAIELVLPADSRGGLGYHNVLRDGELVVSKQGGGDAGVAV